MADIKRKCKDCEYCKYCGRPTLYGELTWLNGKCMCPRCYMKERAKEDGDDNRRDTQMARQSLPG